MRGALPVSTSTRLPTAKWYLSAVALSMTTSLAVVGAPPSTRRTADSCGLAVEGKPQ